MCKFLAQKYLTGNMLNEQMFALWAVPRTSRVSRKLALFLKLDTIWVRKSLMENLEMGGQEDGEEDRFSRATDPL